MYDIAEIFNHSKIAQWLITYKKPQLIIHQYKFQVQLVTKFQTSMHGSAEGHNCYIFRRTEKSGIGAREKCCGEPCDPLFMEAFKINRDGFVATSKHVAEKVNKFFAEKPSRNRKKPHRLTYKY